MNVVLWIFVFIASVAILSKAADYFTHSAEKIGKAFGLSSFIIGGTIVAFGTSLPELVSSLFAVFANSPEIVAGNVIGSNITNLTLILGIVAVVAGRHITVNRELVDVDLPLLIGSALLLGLTIWDQKFTLAEAILFLGGLILFIVYSIISQKKHSLKPHSHTTKRELITPSTVLLLIASGVGIFLGAQYTIKSVIELSHIFNVGADIIAVFAIALGTSLPELAVSLSSIKHKKGELAVGNILGSNIFNIFAIMGIPALFGTLVITPSMLQFYFPLMFAVTLLYYFMASDKSYTRWEGMLLLFFYAYFLLTVFSGM